MSLLNIIEDVMIVVEIPPIPRPPAGKREIFAAGFELVIMWGRSDPNSPEKAVARVNLVTPKGNTFGSEQPVEVDLTQHRRSRTKVRIPGIPAEGEGIYTFVIEEKTAQGDWKHVFEVPITLEVATRELSSGAKQT